MKELFKSFIFLLLGIVFVASFQQLTSCVEEDDWFGDTIGQEEINATADVKKIETAVGEFRSAFKSADQSSIDELTIEESLDLMKGKTTAYTMEELIKIGSAMEKCKRVVTQPNYAEYNYSIDGVTYSFAMATDDNGVWKLLNY